MVQDREHLTDIFSFVNEKVAQKGLLHKLVRNSFCFSIESSTLVSEIFALMRVHCSAV